MRRPRVLLADDHRIVTEGLKSLLEPEFEFVGTVEDGRALIAAAAKLKPDVIVVDISMPLLNGIDAVRQIKHANDSIKIVFLTMHLDVAYAVSAFEAGASGYVLKHSAPSELVSAIRSALSGKIFVTPLLKGELIQKSNAHFTLRDAATRLTERQREIIQLLAEGSSAKEIGVLLNISSRTVEFHKYRIMKDLGLETAAELFHYAIRHGITPE